MPIHSFSSDTLIRQHDNIVVNQISISVGLFYNLRAGSIAQEPLFARCTKILSALNQIYIFGNILQLLDYDSNLTAYEYEELDRSVLINPNDMSYHTGLYSFNYDYLSKSYILDTFNFY